MFQPNQKLIITRCQGMPSGTRAGQTVQALAISPRGGVRIATGGPFWKASRFQAAPQRHLTPEDRELINSISKDLTNLRTRLYRLIS